MSSPELDGNKLAKGKCLVRKAKCLSSFTVGHQFFFLIKSASKGLTCYHDILCKSVIEHYHTRSALVEVHVSTI